MPTHVISANGTEADPTTGNVPVEVVVYKLKTIVTDAQIKLLHTNYVELVPAPGADKLLMLHNALIHTKTQFDVYSGYDVNTTIDIVYGDWVRDACYQVAATAPLNTAGPFISFFPPKYDSGVGYLQGLGWETPGTIVNQSLKLALYNDPNGNVTGGDPANTIEVTVFYSIVDL